MSLSLQLPSCLTDLMRRDNPLASTITYRMGRDMVYLPLARTYIEALQLAVKVFPRLAGIDTDQICLTLTVNLRGQSFPVRISPMSWPDIRLQVVQYEILDVAVSDKVLWTNIQELEETSPSALPSYYASIESVSCKPNKQETRAPFRFIDFCLQVLRRK